MSIDSRDLEKIVAILDREHRRHVAHHGPTEGADNAADQVGDVCVAGESIRFGEAANNI